MLFVHCVRRADSLAACTAGKSIPTRMPIIAMTTSNSTSVKARGRHECAARAARRRQHSASRIAIGEFIFHFRRRSRSNKTLTATAAADSPTTFSFVAISGVVKRPRENFAPIFPPAAINLARRHEFL